MKQDSIQTGLCNEEKNMADSGGLKKERPADKSGGYGTETQITSYEYHGTSDFSVFIYWLLSFAVCEQQAKCTEVLRTDAGSDEGADYGR